MGKRGRPLKFTREQVLEAIETGHTIARAAQNLGCSWRTVYEYARRFPTVAKALQAKRDELIDLAESALWAAVERGEPWAVTFTLKTLGKTRGYSERFEMVPTREVTLELVTRIVRVPEKDRPAEISSYSADMEAPRRD